MNWRFIVVSWCSQDVQTYFGIKDGKNHPVPDVLSQLLKGVCGDTNDTFTEVYVAERSLFLSSKQSLFFHSSFRW